MHPFKPYSMWQTILLSTQMRYLFMLVSFAAILCRASPGFGPCPAPAGGFLSADTCHNNSGVYFWHIPEPKCWCSPTVGIPVPICNASANGYTIISNPPADKSLIYGDITDVVYNSENAIIRASVPLRDTNVYGIALNNGNEFFSGDLSSTIGHCTPTPLVDRIANPTAIVIVSGYKSIQHFDETSTPFTACGYHYDDNRLTCIKRDSRCAVFAILPGYRIYGLIDNCITTERLGPRFVGLMVQY